MHDTRIERPLEPVEFPISLGQLGFLVHHEMFPDAQVLNTGLAIDLRGRLDRTAMVKALRCLVRRHEQLRANFRRKAGTLVAHVEAEDARFFEEIDLSARSPDARDKELRAVEERALCRRFDLATDSLFRVVLVRLADDRHSLILVNHHMTGDGTSLFDLFMRELSALYAASVCGDHSPTIVPVKASFRDFVAWETERNAGRVLERRLRFWRDHLDGAQPTIGLPTDRSRPRRSSGRGGRMEGRRLTAFVPRIEALAGAQSSTVANVLLAAFYALLERCTAQSDLVLGVTVANRLRSEFEGIYGPLINTLPIRAVVQRSGTFAELLDALTATTFRAYAHGDVAFERLAESIEALNRDGRRGHQVVFNFMPFSPTSLALEGLEVSVRRLFSGATFLELAVEVVIEDQDLRTAVEFDADVFDRSSMERLVDQYHLLLQSVVETPDAPLGSHAILTDADRAIIDRCNATRVDLPRQRGVHGLVADRCARTPNATAVLSGDERTSFAELDRRARCVAARLTSSGCKPGDLVGHYFGRTAELLVTILGIWKAGCAYVPLDPSFPSARVRWMLEDSGARVVVADRTHAARLTAENVEVLVVDSGSAEAPPPPSDPVLEDGDRIAYLIYTSGSAGKPKGVAVPHRAVVNFLLSMQRTPGLSPSERVLAVTTVSFDISVLELFLPLVTGATTVLATREEAQDGRTLTAILDREMITFMQATPITYRLLLEAGWQGGHEFRALVGGEAFPPELVEPLTTRCREVWNMYGPTETTVWSTCHRLVAGEPSIPIGKPIANTTVHLLDASGPVPLGSVGELHIGGEGLAVGYHDRAELTAERFIADPADPSRRLYRTGDLARQLSDGSLQHVGRVDDQVKVRGFRIELREIEAEIESIRGVDHAAATVIRDPEGGSGIAAFFVTHADGLDGSAIRSALGRTLPAYMIPSSIERIAAIPLTANGKIDRNALPTEDLGVVTRNSADTVPPRNDTETRLVAIVEELLRVPHVGIHDDFFALGGHSLVALRLVNRVAEEMDVEIDLLQVFETPTIAGLSDAMGGSTVRGSRSIVPLARAVGGTPIYGVCGIHLYQRLAHALARPFHAIYLPEEADLVQGRTRAGCTSIRDLARSYYETVRAFHSGGPLRLVGFCVGGVVAFEIAKLATADGMEVDWLVLLETALLRRIPRTRWSRLRSEAGRWVKTVRGGLVRRLGSRNTSEPRQSIDELNLERALAALVRAYVAGGSFAGRVALIRAAEEDALATPRRGSELLGWEGLLTGQVEIVRLPGDHLGILHEPIVGLLAEHLLALWPET